MRTVMIEVIVSDPNAKPSDSALDNDPVNVKEDPSSIDAVVYDFLTTLKKNFTVVDCAVWHDRGTNTQASDIYDIPVDKNADIEVRRRKTF